MPTIAEGFECKAKCSCGTFSFFVRYRRKGEDIVGWLEGEVRPAMARAHMQRLCQATACDLMMPLDEGVPGIGMRVEH